MGCEICYDFDRPTLALMHRTNKLKSCPFTFKTLEKSAVNGCLGCEILLKGAQIIYNLRSKNYHLQCINSESSVFLIAPNEKFPDIGVVEFYFPNDDPMCENNVGDSSSSHWTDLEHSVQWIKNRLRICDGLHSACIKSEAMMSTQAVSPARLLELRKGDTEHVFLEDKSAASARYMTLSHCWGTYQPMTTTSSTIQQRKTGILVSALPRTFQDAIHITRRLGVDYLWIDSLCIVQDDANDWNTESAKMASIYSNSFLNLSATKSSDGTGGCVSSTFAAVETQKAKQLKISLRQRNYIRDCHGELQNMSLDRNYESTRLSSPLLSRAWAYQERLLSSRNVNFHREELVWECASSISCECGKIINSIHQRRPVTTTPSVETIQIDSGGLSENTDCRRRRWYGLVRQYSGLSARFPKDRLPALAGLAKNFSPLFGDGYLAGLWKQDIWYGLQWSILSENADLVPRRAKFRAPTWSWASIEYRSGDEAEAGSLTQPTICFDGWRSDRIEQRASISEAHCVPLDPKNPFGEVTSGLLTIEARSLQPTLHWSKYDTISKNKCPEPFRLFFLLPGAEKKDAVGRVPSTYESGDGYSQGGFSLDVVHWDAGLYRPPDAAWAGYVYAPDFSTVRCISMGAIRETNYIKKAGRPEVAVSYLRHQCMLIRELDTPEKRHERIGLGTVDDYEDLFTRATPQRFELI